MKRLPAVFPGGILGFVALLLAAGLWAGEQPEFQNAGEPINTPFDEFSPSISADGRSLVFNSRRVGEDYQDLMISELVADSGENRWSPPRPLAELNSAYNDESPYLTPDGTVIIFSSDRDGSLEMPRDEQGRVRVSFDLHWSHKAKDGSGWSPPLPVPGNVNTPHHERSPALDARTGSLYFSRWPFGNFEDAKILAAQYRAGRFVDVSELPASVNSGHNEAGFVPADDGQGFYFSSRRPGGLGGWDVYFIPRAADGSFGEAQNLGPAVNSTEHEIGFSLRAGRTYFSSNRAGGRGRYDIYGTPTRFAMDLRKDATVTLHNILFDANEAVPRPESLPVLREILSFLKNNPRVRLGITGHTDLHGEVEYNLELSRRRAAAVRDFLVTNGVAAERLTVDGAGFSRPLVQAMTPEADARNRRTEFRVLEVE